MGLGPKVKKPRAIENYRSPSDRAKHAARVEVTRLGRKLLSNEYRRLRSKAKAPEADLEAVKSAPKDLIANAALRRMGLGFVGVGKCPMDEYVKAGGR